MKPRALLLLKLLLCFLPLALFRDELAVCYRSLLEVIGSLLSIAEVGEFVCGDVCSFRLIVYLLLVIATPKLDLARRLVALLIGLGVFAAIDLTGIYLWPTALPLAPLGEQPFVQQVYGFVWDLLRNMLLPLLLWLVICDKHLGLFFFDADIAANLQGNDRFSEG